MKSTSGWRMQGARLLVALLLALLSVVAASSHTYSLSGLLYLQLIPASEYSDGDCVLGNCTTDRVTNIFLTDIVDGGGPCFMAENLNSRSLGESLRARHIKKGKN